MNIILERATETAVQDYIRIGKLTQSHLNTVVTEPDEVRKEIRESVVYLIKSRHQVIGFISYVMKADRHAYISEVQVDPAFQGQGIGRTALEEVLEELEDVDVVELHTHPDNPARRLYARCGFEPTGEVIQNFHGTGQPRIQMVLRQYPTM